MTNDSDLMNGGFFFIRMISFLPWYFRPSKFFPMKKPVELNTSEYQLRHAQNGYNVTLFFLDNFRKLAHKI